MRYQVLSCWEKFSISPLEWNKIDKQTQMDLLAKLFLDNERDARISMEMKNKSNNSKGG
jgi:hypothetical protein